jgi:hypothetical protein
MPLSTRGRTRQLVKAVPVTDSLNYAFKTADLASIAGVSADDITALGQVNLTGITGLVVFSPRSPKPAQFRKTLTGGAQGSVTAYGNGLTASAVNTAAGRGWIQTRGIRGCAFGNTTRSASVAVKVSNGLLIKYMIPIGDAGNATVLGLQTTLTAADLKKLVFAPSSAKVALVKKNGVTLPCSFDAIADATNATNGWKLVRPEYGFAAAAPAGGGAGG